MLDIKFIRENKDLIKEAIRKKHLECDLDELLAVDTERRRLLGKVEELRAQQNQTGQKISRVSDAEERQPLIAEMQKVKEELQSTEKDLEQVMKRWRQLMIEIPNIPDITVPEGESDEDNRELRQWGKKPEFDFTPQSHIELFKSLDMADLERGVKVAGFRGYFLKNDGALLSLALWNLAMEYFASRGDFTPMIAPSLTRKEPFMGTGYLPQGEEDLYKTQDDTFLAGTSEVATMGYYQNEILEYDQLPLKFVVFSPCFRREAGSHGKDTKGLMRLHEFYKVEQVVLCHASHQESVDQHEELLANAETIMQKLELPYRVVANCGGDLGLGQVKKYDIETWVPSEDRYRETHSISYFHDWQTRRLNIRYKDENGDLRFVHSLNGTALATPRVLIQLSECNQTADGSMVIPTALRTYMNGRDKITSASQTQPENGDPGFK